MKTRYENSEDVDSKIGRIEDIFEYLPNCIS